jgi:hypothetical protein
VGDGHDRARVLLEVSLEPGDGLGVEVIGRLVEQQQVGFLEQHAAQRDAAALAAGKGGHVGVAGRNAQRLHGQLECAVELPCVRRVDVILKLSLLLEQRIHLRCVERVREARARSSSRCARTPSSTLPSTSFVGSSSGSWARWPTRMPGVGRASPTKSASRPAMIRSKLLLPAPLSPSTPILAPGRKASVMSSRITRAGGTTFPRFCIV